MKLHVGHKTISALQCQQFILSQGPVQPVASGDYLQLRAAPRGADLQGQQGCTARRTPEHPRRAPGFSCEPLWPRALPVPAPSHTEHWVHWACVRAGNCCQRDAPFSIRNRNVLIKCPTYSDTHELEISPRLFFWATSERRSWLERQVHCPEKKEKKEVVR